MCSRASSSVSSAHSTDPDMLRGRIPRLQARRPAFRQGGSAPKPQLTQAARFGAILAASLAPASHRTGRLPCCRTRDAGIGLKTRVSREIFPSR
jgi:hypothetical protein